MYKIVHKLKQGKDKKRKFTKTKTNDMHAKVPSAAEHSSLNKNRKHKKPLEFQRFFVCKKIEKNKSTSETLAWILLFNSGEENTKSIIGGELDDIQYPKMFYSRW